MFTEKRIQAGKLGLNMAVGPPTGPPLLLLHGVTRRWQCLLPVLPVLASRWHVHVVDFPGHGRSDRLDGEYLVAAYADVAAELVDALFPGPLAVYGHSLGAMAAAAVAARHPGSVAGLVLEDPPWETMGRRIGETALKGYFDQLRAFVGTHGPLAEAAARLADVRLTDPTSGQSQRLGQTRDAAALRFTADCLSRIDPKVLEPIVQARWLEGFEWPAIARRIECPALLIQADGAAGGMLTDEDAEQMAQAIDNLARVRFEGVGHQVHWLRPAELTNAVFAFLETIDRLEWRSRNWPSAT